MAAPVHQHSPKMKEKTTEDLKSQVGSALKAFRKKQNLTLEDAAAKTGQAASNLSYIERGIRNISLDILEEIVNGYGVEIQFKIKKQDA